MIKKGLYLSVEFEYYVSFQFKDYGYLGFSVKILLMRIKNLRILYCYFIIEVFKLLG